MANIGDILNSPEQGMPLIFMMGEAIQWKQ